MKVAIVVNGTRGDVQPMLALAKGLIRNGHKVIVCAPPENEELLKQYRIPFVAFGLSSIRDVWTHWMGDNVIAACDKDLQAVRDGVSFRFTQTGYMLLSSNIGLPDKVEKFLNSGNPPVFIGFGSNPVSHL